MPKGPTLDFSNTEIAFSDKTDKELKQVYRLFQMMNNQTIVNLGSNLGLFALKLGLPFAHKIVRSTIFDHFCGGENLMDCQPVIDRLFRMNVLTILDYGAESKTTEDELDNTVTETLKAIEFAASNDSVPVVSTKVTALADNVLLQKLQNKEELNDHEKHAKNKLDQRLLLIGEKAQELNVGVFFDAEETWMQDAIDDLINEMMPVFNKERAIVYNTYQLYRVDKLASLQEDFEEAASKGYILGAKIVRGAYMEKERARAKELGRPSLIHATKAATDADFNEAVRFCVGRYERIASCNASHNWESNLLQAQLIEERGILKNHPHLNFCQLYGMSDNITFNLANAGYNIAKYLPYGPVKEVVQYLIRRAQENATVAGDMSRELKLIKDEIRRRGL